MCVVYNPHLYIPVFTSRSALDLNTDFTIASLAEIPANTQIASQWSSEMPLVSLS